MLFSKSLVHSLSCTLQRLICYLLTVQCLNNSIKIIPTQEQVNAEERLTSGNISKHTDNYQNNVLTCSNTGILCKKPESLARETTISFHCI